MNINDKMRKAVDCNSQLGIKVKAKLIGNNVSILTHEKHAEIWRYDVLQLDVSNDVKKYIVRKLNKGN